MSSQKTNTVQSRTTVTNLDQFEFEENTYRESSLENNEITIDEFSALQETNNEFRNGNLETDKKRSALVNQESIQKTSETQHNEDLSSDSEIDFGFTLNVNIYV